MAHITVDQLNAFTDNTVESEVKTEIVESASEVVIDFLGYDPALAERVYRFIGLDNDSIVLPIPGAVQIDFIKIGGQALDEDDYELIPESNLLQLNNGIVFARDKRVEIQYLAGFATMPARIVHAALRIAGLMWQEAQGNIGLTGKSFADMSRNFVNYTNYDKYLRPLSALRKGEL